MAKIAGLKLCESMRLQYGFDTISLMPTNLYGPNDNYDPISSHVIAAMIRRFIDAERSDIPSVTCWGTGSSYREFLHVDDMAEAAIFCLENWDPNSESSPRSSNGDVLTWLNVGTGKDISIKSLADKISKIVGYKGEIFWDNSKPDGTPKKLLCVDKINKLGWNSKISLDEGLIRTITEIKNGNEKKYF